MFFRVANSGVFRKIIFEIKYDFIFLESCLVGRGRLNEAHNKYEFFLSFLLADFSQCQITCVLPRNRVTTRPYWPVQRTADQVSAYNEE